ncbi:MAG TPA: hypothetical protein VMU83_03755 [Hanamia sp.]|nr:hypothetical protein [Hanamia sp.]
MKIVLFFFFVILFLNTRGQTTIHKFSEIISAKVGVPTGLFSSVYSFTAGGSAGAKYSLSDQSSLSGTIGFQQFFRKGGGEGISFVPVMGGFQYHFIPEAFISFEAGMAIPTYANGGIVGSIIPAFGYQINRHLSADLNYTGFAQYGFLVGGINTRLSYSF